MHKKSKFGVTLTEDNCIEKDYSVRCPGGWKDKGDGWCLPPKYYQVSWVAAELVMCLAVWGHPGWHVGTPMDPVVPKGKEADSTVVVSTGESSTPRFGGNSF